MKSKTVLFFYFIVLCIEIVGEFYLHNANSAYLVYFSKPLLMPLLIAWAFFYAHEQNITFNKIIFVALTFSMFGDIALMLLNIFSLAFIIGLVCFLIAHLIYIVLFSKISSNNYSIILKKPYLILPFVLYGILLLSYLYRQNHPEFIKMQLAVLIYAVVILTMLLMAVCSYKKGSKNSYIMLTLGAALFVLSDSTIALSQFSYLFVNKQESARFIIMLLYGSAQFLIVKGYISMHKNSTIKSLST